MQRFNKIVIADENEVAIDCLYRAIKNIDRHARMAFFYNGDQCLNYLKAAQPADLIFLNVNMPITDGLACMEWIKKHEQYNKIPTVVFSELQNISDVQAFYECGTAFFVLKPVTQEAYNILLSRLFALLNLQDFERTKSSFFFIKKS